MTRHDAVIIGAGAAGLYAAAQAGQRGRRVLVLEHGRTVGAKILISGGGRCNFTNREGGDHERYLSQNPQFPRSALSRHPPSDFLAMIEKHRIAYYEKTLGQLFCEGARASQNIVRMLLDECAAGGVEIRTGVSVSEVNKAHCFTIETSHGRFEGETLTIATGGLSIPKLGATNFAFTIAEHFGVPIAATRPGLVPLTVGASDLEWMGALSGVSCAVIARAGSGVFCEAALFTHRGLSGPAILQASSYWREGEVITIDWAPDQSLDFLVRAKRDRPKAHLRSALAQYLPDRLAGAFATRGLTAPLGDAPDEALAAQARALKQHQLRPIGTEGYAKAEVMCGGVDTDALSQKTMECRRIPGLFFIGECVDVTGWLGGYNFQWAWSSGWAAGQAI